MLHVWVFTHPLLVFSNFIERAKKKIVIQIPRVIDYKPYN